MRMESEQFDLMMTSLDDDQFDEWVKRLKRKQSEARKKRTAAFHQAVASTSRDLKKLVKSKKGELNQVRVQAMAKYTDKIAENEKMMLTSYEACKLSQVKLKKHLEAKKRKLAEYSSSIKSISQKYKNRQLELETRQEAEWKDFYSWTKQRLEQVKKECNMLLENKEDILAVTKMLYQMLVELGNEKVLYSL